MRISTNTSKWYDRPWAAFIFFTRLPFWRIHQPPKDAYESVVEFWPLAGWLTGALMGAIIWFGSKVLPFPIVLLTAIAARLLITGALHEDGLADFFDGFGGGGKDRSRILAIMKDSHIGTFGVLSLIVYFALFFTCMLSLGPLYAALVACAADPFCKMVAGQITQILPYARNEEQAKAHNLYRKFNLLAGLSLMVQGLAPFIGLLYFDNHWGSGRLDWNFLVAAPCLTMFFLYMLMLRRIKGYTGDCCGAVFLLCELAFHLTAVVLLTSTLTL
ncbi:adenosylcobinamide-GDP ribazoletransferase [Hoylesella loescheii]|uniref:adenosylcobinamide-GDP ribazoletransferase n=1 Tax=Hoylesella loescheii TaxID=840 RepID=UPI0026ED0BC3|nr:adenosylcobinamide-GDP ribazoletransferase [Hoylesella loescheii]